jgi:hypothetical protein
MIKYKFLGVGDSVRYGEAVSVPLAIPTQALQETSVSNAFLKSIDVPDGYTSLAWIKLLYRKSATASGNVNLKFAFAHISKSGGVPVEDADAYTLYAVSAGTDTSLITVPAAAYSALTAMVAGDEFFLSAYRDGTNVLDTFAADFEVAGFIIAYNTTEASIYNDDLDIVTLAQVKDYMGVTETTYDVLFASWITMISQMIENVLMQPVKPITIEEILNGDGTSKLFLNKGRIIDLVIDPVTSSKLDSLEYRDSALVAWARIIEDAGLYFLDPQSSWCIELLDNYVFTSGIKNIRVYYSAGFSPIPADIVKMVLEMIQIMWDESKAGTKPRLGMASKSSGGVGSSLGDSFMDMDVKWQKIINRYKRLC